MCVGEWGQGVTHAFWMPGIGNTSPIPIVLQFWDYFLNMEDEVQFVIPTHQVGFWHQGCKMDNGNWVLTILHSCVKDARGGWVCPIQLHSQKHSQPLQKSVHLLLPAGHMIVASQKLHLLSCMLSCQGKSWSQTTKRERMGSVSYCFFTNSPIGRKGKLFPYSWWWGQRESNRIDSFSVVEFGSLIYELCSAWSRKLNYFHPLKKR